MVLSTETDTSLDWLRAGLALERVLLMATRRGVAASFLTQPFEPQDRNATPIYRPPSWLKHPQVVSRLGYGPSVAGTPQEAFADLADYRIQPPPPVRPQHAEGEPAPCVRIGHPMSGIRRSRSPAGCRTRLESMTVADRTRADGRDDRR